MAKYQRSFLVPYLRDIYSLEVLNSTINREISGCKKDIAYYTKELDKKIIPVKTPNKSDFEKESSDAGAPRLIAFAAFFVGLWLVSLKLTLLPLIAFGFGAIMLLASLIVRSEEKSACEKSYCNAVNSAKKQEEQNSAITKIRPQYETKLAQCRTYLLTLQKRSKEVQTLCNKLYAVNVIPSKYRNIYAAYYLYDYFNTTREDDLDKIIQTLLLDEIKQNLSVIIAQNEQIILNQRTHIAMEERNNKMLTTQHREQMQKLIQMEQNQELQIDYQKMLSINQEVTNFFLAADYLRINR